LRRSLSTGDLAAFESIQQLQLDDEDEDTDDEQRNNDEQREPMEEAWIRAQRRASSCRLLEVIEDESDCDNSVQSEPEFM